MFGVLLRYWRNVRGLSQNDLAATADVSSRHLSFLETGRAQPSRDMVLRLGAALDVPMREQNAMLRAAGFADQFADPGLGDTLDPLVRRTLGRMLRQQEPYPMLVMNSYYDIVNMNAAAQRVFSHLLGDRLAGLTPPLNVCKLAFDERALRPVISDWAEGARFILLRLQREVLLRPADAGLKELLATLCTYPGVPMDWRTPNLEVPCAATFNVSFDLEGKRYGFLTALTVFNAPQNITVEELRLESYYPLDDATEELCMRLAREQS